jgi:hypothetical protein
MSRKYVFLIPDKIPCSGDLIVSKQMGKPGMSIDPLETSIYHSNPDTFSGDPSGEKFLALKKTRLFVENYLPPDRTVPFKSKQEREHEQEKD